MTYNEITELVNVSYERTQDVPGVVKETEVERLVVLEMIGVSDWLAFVEDNNDD